MLLFKIVINSVYALNLVNYWFTTASESWLFVETIFEKKAKKEFFCCSSKM